MNITLRKSNPNNDLKYLNEIRGKELPKLHASRFAEQKENKAVYLIAFKDEWSVGCVYVKFESSEKYHTCPMLQDLYVKSEFRGQGIAVQIIKQTEKYLKELGYNEIGIDVETSEEWIRQFYEKQGFKLKSGSHKQSWIEKDSGKEIIMNIFHLEKRI